MQELLHIKLHDYLAVHYPDMLLGLRKEGKEEAYIQEKVSGISVDMEAMLAGDNHAYMVEIHCMDVLIESLGPSMYDYIYNILEDDFGERLADLESLASYYMKSSISSLAAARLWMFLTKMTGR